MKFKLHQFVLALAGAVLISASASTVSTAVAAPAAPAALNGTVQGHTIDVQRHRRGRHYRGRGRHVGPAIALGIFGAAAAAAAANSYYGPAPYGYYDAPPQRCFVVTDPVYNRGYWTAC